MPRVEAAAVGRKVRVDLPPCFGKGEKAMVEHDDDFDSSDKGKRYTVTIGAECGMTAGELARHKGEYLKLDINPISKEIFAATVETPVDDELEDRELARREDSSPQYDRTQVGISYYSTKQFSKAKSAGLFAGDDFRNYKEWQESHAEIVRKMMEMGYRVADVEVRVPEFLEWQRVSKRYGRGAVSFYVADLLKRGQRILKWHAR
jgi:hypothetical protein